MKICYIEMSSYMGIAPGATHIYGTLIITNNKEYQKEQIERILTEMEAFEINAKAEKAGYVGRYKARAGATHSGFQTEAEVIAHGRLLFTKLCDPATDLLFLGSSVYAEPQKALDGPATMVHKINTWVSQLEEYRANNNESGEISLCNEYWEWVQGLRG